MEPEKIEREKNFFEFKSRQKKTRRKLFLVIFFLLFVYLIPAQNAQSGFWSKKPAIDRGAMQVKAEKKDWKIGERPSFEIEYSQRGFWRIIWDYLSYPFSGKRDVKVEVLDSEKRILAEFREGQEYETEKKVEGFKINMLRKTKLNPGRYTVRASFREKEREYKLSQDFSWGVLTLNYDKTYYSPGERAYLQMAVLNEKGDTICDAELDLRIRNSKGKEIKIFSTVDNSIEKSPDCGPQTVTNKPDYFAYFEIPKETEDYNLELIARTANGEYTISDQIVVKEPDEITFVVERVSATRIYPLSLYQVEINVAPREDFEGNILEEVPINFEIKDTKLGKVNDDGGIENEMPASKVENVSEERKKIEWTNIALKKNEKWRVVYTYDAPDMSPWIFNLGSLKLLKPESLINNVISSFYSSYSVIFDESRQWQLASDQVANLIMLYDDATTTAPSGWSCISCDATAPFYQRFIRGSNVYGGTGGSETHAHPDPSPITSGTEPEAGTGGEDKNSQWNSLYGHTHTASLQSGLTAPNSPPYRNFKVIKYNNGIPSQIPAGAIAFFNGTTAPSGWTKVYNGDNRFIKGDTHDVVTATGGSSTHRHIVALGATSEAPNGQNSNTTLTDSGAQNYHSHGSDSSYSDYQNLEPPYTTVSLGKNGTSPVSIPIGIIAMFDATPPSSAWEARSGTGGTNPFYQNFTKITGTSGSSGGSSSHTHANVDITTYINSGTARFDNSPAEVTYANYSHTHTFSVSFGSAVDHKPLYRDVIFSEATSMPAPDIHELYYRWRNDNGSELAATPKANQNASANLRNDNNYRLRLSLSNSGSAEAASQQFRLEYGVKSSTCAAISGSGPTGWNYLGVGGTNWVMQNSSYLTDGDAASNIPLSVGLTDPSGQDFGSKSDTLKDTSSQTGNISLANGEFSELEFSIKPNNITSGDYCFRLTNSGDTTNFNFSDAAYPEASVVLSNATLNQRTGIIKNDQIGTTVPNGSTVYIGERLRVRIQVDSGPEWESANKIFKLQYDKNDNSWQDVRPVGEIRPAQSTVVHQNYILSGPEAGVCSGGKTWNPRKVWNKILGKTNFGKTFEAQAATEAVSMSGDTCDEMEFLVDTKNASAGTTYRFRLKNLTDNSELSNYYAYPSFVTVTAGNNSKRYSLSNTPSLATGATPPAILDMVYKADEQGYSNLASDDSNREILQNIGVMTTVPSLTFPSPTNLNSGYFGYSVDTGDFNGDGYADALIGACGNNSIDGKHGGFAYIFNGGPAMSTAPSLTFPNPTNLDDDMFGYSVAADDFNGDGYPDALIGAVLDNSQGTDRGRAYIFNGGPAMSTAPSLAFPDPTNLDNDYFGGSVAAGDFNSDGYADALIGAYQDNNLGTKRGRAYIFNGGPAMSTAPSLAFPDPTNLNDDMFGISAATDDFNGDGYADALIGAYQDNNLGTKRGRAYIFNGGPAMSTAPSLAFPDPTNLNDDNFGYSVTSGDFNGDGYADALIGAYRDNSKGAATYRGRAYIFNGGPAMSTAPSLAFPDPSNLNGDNFGSNVTSDDFNGDGYADALIGAFGDNSKGDSRGRAYVFNGGPAMSTAPSLAFPDPTNMNQDWFGYQVGSGDFNGDGYPDALIGAYGDNSQGDYTYRGRMYVYYGSYLGISATSANNADKIITGGASNDVFGNLVASAGDVNGDGYNDVIMGAYAAPYSGSAGPGRAYIYYGGPAGIGKTSANNADVIISGSVAGDNFSYSSNVSLSGGDVNGDGYSDVILGANSEDSGGTDAGRAYIYYGGSLGASISANSANVIITGNAGSDYFGEVVAFAGDVNGDGYGDIIVGASNADKGSSTRTGRAYIYYGGSLGASISANSASVIITGGATGGLFGSSVSQAGDVNGDGYSDVIVGAYSEDYGGTDAGRAYIYYGGSLGASISANSASVIITGGYSADVLGNSVASAGDVNGDSYSDVIVGANGYYFGAYRGRAYIFYGGSLGASISANSANVIITGNATGDEFSQVASAGDVNGDGYSDVIVRARAYSGGNHIGRAYIFYGGSLGASISANSANVIITGGAANDWFGGAANSAGDVNGDGYSDVIISAGGYSSSTGRAYLYLGGGITAYPVFNFAEKSGSACAGLSEINATWNGQSSVGASTKHIFLQVYNFNSASWETPTNGENSALVSNIDGDISVTLNSSLGYYCDGNNWSYWRAYQDTGNNILRSDYFDAAFNGGAEPPTNDSATSKGSVRAKGNIRFK